jgi:hypothetical protein
VSVCVQALPSLQAVPLGALFAWHCPIPLQVSGAVQTLLAGLPQEDPDDSNWQVAEQQSPPTVLLSSHCSPLSTVPLPQTAAVHACMLHPAGAV